MKEKRQGDGSQKTEGMFGTIGASIFNNSGKIFIGIIVVTILALGTQALFTHYKKTSTEEKNEDVEVTAINRETSLEPAYKALENKDYEGAIKEASSIIEDVSSSVTAKIEGYLIRGEASMYLKKCKDAESDMYMAANIAPNDVSLQDHISTSLNNIFYGKECAENYVK